MSDKKRENGFTLVELIVTAALVFILLLLSFVFVHPRDYTAKNRNAVRWLGVAQLAQTLNRYQAENGKLPDGLTSTPQIIGNADKNLDWCEQLVPKYVADVPLDPVQGYQVSIDTCRATSDAPSAYSTGFAIQKNKDGTVVISAPYAEGGQHVQISRKY